MKKIIALLALLSLASAAHAEPKEVRFVPAGGLVDKSSWDEIQNEVKSGALKTNSSFVIRFDDADREKKFEIRLLIENIGNAPIKISNFSDSIKLLTNDGKTFELNIQDSDYPSKTLNPGAYVICKIRENDWSVSQQLYKSFLNGAVKQIEYSIHSKRMTGIYKEELSQN